MKRVYSILLIVIIFVGCNKDEITSPLEIETSVMADSRDGQVYKIVRIGKQLWMAENLNYRTPIGSWYYYNDSSTFAKPFGRLYLWDTAMQGEESSNRNPSNVKGISPEGWHICQRIGTIV